MRIDRSDLNALLAATVVAAVLDAGFAFVSYVVIAGRYDFESLLQYIASGLLGHGAFSHGGLTGWLIAALGFALHLVISFTVAAIYFVAIRPLARTRPAAIVAGLLYGAAIWVFNDAVVLPLFDTRHEPFVGGWYIPFLIDHALFVGLAIALIADWGARKDRAQASPMPIGSSGVSAPA
jgi:hypothetical protein